MVRPTEPRPTTQISWRADAPVDEDIAADLPGFPSVWSDDRLYRYTLWRWFTPRPARFMLMIGLNPSAADNNHDDRTVRRCWMFAKDLGYDALIMANAFGYMATDPDDMKRCDEPVGPENDTWIRALSDVSDIVIAGWGTHAVHLERESALLDLLPRDKLHALKITAKGHPGHPLYLPKTSRPVPWPQR